MPECDHKASKTRRPKLTRAVKPWKKNARSGTLDMYNMRQNITGKLICAVYMS